jgi:amino acid transporter
MDFEVLKACWQQDVRRHVPPPLEAHTMSELGHRRASDLRRDVRRRLRREMTWYVPMLAVALVSFGDGFTWMRVLYALGTLVVLGSIIMVLWLAERRLAAMSVDGSLRDVLIELIARIDWASRAYHAAYVLVFIGSGIVIAIVIWRRQGVGPMLGATLLAASVAVMWAYASGRAYVQRMFRQTRTDLGDCLRDLDAG